MKQEVNQVSKIQIFARPTTTFTEVNKETLTAIDTQFSRAGKPHYVVGLFHNFEAKAKVLLKSCI